MPKEICISIWRCGWDLVRNFQNLWRMNTYGEGRKIWSASHIGLMHNVLLKKEHCKILGYTMKRHGKTLDEERMQPAKKAHSRDILVCAMCVLRLLVRDWDVAKRSGKLKELMGRAFSSWDCWTTEWVCDHRSDAVMIPWSKFASCTRWKQKWKWHSPGNVWNNIVTTLAVDGGLHQ